MVRASGGGLTELLLQRDCAKPDPAFEVSEAAFSSPARSHFAASYELRRAQAMDVDEQAAVGKVAKDRSVAVASVWRGRAPEAAGMCS